MTGDELRRKLCKKVQLAMYDYYNLKDTEVFYEALTEYDTWLRGEILKELEPHLNASKIMAWMVGDAIRTAGKEK